MTDDREQIYLLLDSTSAPLARGKLESPVSAQNLQIRVLEGKAEDVALHEIIQLVGKGSGELAVQCRLLQQRGDRIVLGKGASLGEDFRRNLRIPVKFKSFLYPISGTWKGRREVQSVDLSCGGISFRGEYGLENRERVEIVIPITVEPLVLRCEILRQQALRGDRAFYAAKFVDMCDDEETLVREAVFRVQLQDRSRRPDEGELITEVRK